MDRDALDKLLDAVSESCPTSALFHFHHHQSLEKAPTTEQQQLEQQASRLIVPLEARASDDLDSIMAANDLFEAICIDHAESQALPTEVVTYIEEQTREQSSSNLWIALHGGQTHHKFIIP